MLRKVSTEGLNLKLSNRILAYSSTDRAHGYGPWFVVSSNLTKPAIKFKGRMSMKLYELAYLNVEKDKNSRNFGVMNKFINGKTSHNIVKKSKQEKEEVICYLNGRAMTKSKLEKTFPKKKNKSKKKKYVKKKNTKE